MLSPQIMSNEKNMENKSIWSRGNPVLQIKHKQLNMTEKGNEEVCICDLWLISVTIVFFSSLFWTPFTNVSFLFWLFWNKSKLKSTTRYTYTWMQVLENLSTVGILWYKINTVHITVSSAISQELRLTSTLLNTCACVLLRQVRCEWVFLSNLIGGATTILRGVLASHLNPTLFSLHPTMRSHHKSNSNATIMIKESRNYGCSVSSRHTLSVFICQLPQSPCPPPIYLIL